MMSTFWKFTLLCLPLLCEASICQVGNIRKILPSVNLEPQSGYEWIFYGLTQDCQIFFARPDQLDQLQHLNVQSRVTYCLPNLVQLHWRQFHHHGVEGFQMGLQLLFKRANNQICTLPIEFPSKNALSGFSIFSYSVLSSLNYASCSYMTNSSFIMEPDLSFMDTSYSDVIYFADPDSRNSYWNIRQFKFDKDGYFKAMETFIVKNFAEEKDKTMLCARDHLLALDGQRHKLHAIQRHNKVVTSTCAYDLLFRPSKATIKKLDSLRHDSAQFRVNSFAADGTHLLIGESHRKSHDQFSTKVFLSERDKNDSSECILQLPFLAEFGFISIETKDSLEKIHLPRFSHRKTHKIPHQPRNGSESIKEMSAKSKLDANTKVIPKTTTTTARTTEKDEEPEEQENDVGDGRILDSEEVEQRKKQEDEEDDELGLMTEITTKNVPAENEDQLAEGSGDLISSEVLNKENLNSTACWRCEFYPVLIAFTAMVLIH